MKIGKLKDGKCPGCGGTTFFANEISAWKAEVEADGNLHCYKCYESSTEDITCVNRECAMVIEPDSVEIYYD